MYALFDENYENRIFFKYFVKLNPSPKKSKIFMENSTQRIRNLMALYT